MKTSPALTVPCPTCHVGPGKPCRSYRDIAIHSARRQVLADSRPPKPVLRGPDGLPVAVVVGKTGGPVVDNNESWPPWETGPVSGCAAGSNPGLGGVLWCPAHRRHEELSPAWD